MTWDDLVRSTGLSQSAIRKIEDGRTSNPGVFTLLRIWRALNLPIEGIGKLVSPP
jgi:predicted transcriptional regulator